MRRYTFLLVRSAAGSLSKAGIAWSCRGKALHLLGGSVRESWGMGDS